ncbi:MAG: glycoside hydrolase family 3 protein [Treponema sp.]|nr:glycoside hydrolase family 3 protein [Treponema sp.]
MNQSRAKKFFTLLAFFFICSALFADGIFSNSKNDHLPGGIKNEELLEKAKKLPANINFWSDYPSDVLSRAIVERMTNEELFAQIFMFGWAGAEPEQLLFNWVERGLGSVKVFGWNTDDIQMVAKAVSALQRSASRTRFKIPLFVATDQEGGWIRHVKGETSITPGNMAIGAAGYPVDAWYSAFYISREIKALGINMNFAPSVDLFTNHSSTIIGPRSFGDNPQNVGILGAAFVSGSIEAGVIPTAKHFPGHGDTENDSHIHLPEITIDEKTFLKRELVPFEHLIKQNVPAIMSGHLSFPKIDSTGAPASLSKYFLTDLLRKKLKYSGLIITDDMMMNGDTLYAGSLTNAFRLAVEAGNDIVISSTLARMNEPLWTNNLSLMQTDETFYWRVKDAAYRVIKTKLDYFKNTKAAPLYPDAKTIYQFIPDKEGEQFFFDQACRSITVYKGDVPLPKDNAGRVLLAGSMQKFFSEGKKRYPNSSELYYNITSNQEELQEIRNTLSYRASNYDTIICLVSNWQSARVARSLQNSGKRVIILSIMSPEDSFEFNWADSVLMGYSWSAYTLDALFGALIGEFSPQGILPFKK